jgi:N-acetylneuraminate synthase
VTWDFAFASVVSLKNIIRGEELSSKNLWVKRPGTGDFKLNQLKDLYGKKAKNKILQNTQIKKTDVC